MKIGILLFGIFLIIGAVSEYSFSTIILDKVSNMTNNIVASMIPTMSTNPENKTYTPKIMDTNAKAFQLTSSITMLETKVMDYTSWASMIMGIVFVTYGTLAKNNTRVKSSNSESLDVLKMRLAKGEITKNQFDHLKNDVA